MAKYSVEFKKKAVDLCLTEGLGTHTVATQLGISKGFVELWLARFRAHGIAGLEKKFTNYSAEFKVEVLERMDSEGLSMRAASTMFDIRNSDALRLWRLAYDQGGIEALMRKPRGRSRPMKPKPPATPDKSVDTPTIEQLLKENEYLRAEVAYLKKLDALIQAKKLAAQKKRK